MPGSEVVHQGVPDETTSELNAQFGSNPPRRTERYDDAAASTRLRATRYSESLPSGRLTVKRGRTGRGYAVTPAGGEEGMEAF
jgi:hypothetical protein